MSKARKAEFHFDERSLEKCKCPNCGSGRIIEEKVTSTFDYATIKEAFSANFPAIRCQDCAFGWRDWRSEIAIDTAMNAFVNNEPTFTRADEQALLSEAEYYEGKIKGDG